MIINGCDFEANNEIEYKALASKEKSIIEDPNDYQYGIKVLDTELMRLAIALRAENECSSGYANDFNILIAKGGIEVSFKRDTKWEPFIIVVPENAELFYAAYLLEENEPLKKAFFKKLRRSEYYKNNDMYHCFKNFKKYTVDIIKEGLRIEETIYI